jgi:DNA-binding CsgD family transcriptional regulator
MPSMQWRGLVCQGVRLSRAVSSAEARRAAHSATSNKEIGARLFISERTVESHVRNILNQRGFNTRAQIAGWIATSRTG